MVRRIGELPPMPRVAQKALSMMRDPDSSMTELADVLALDQALAGLVLRWANSAYYGLVHPVATVRQAVVYLGQRTIQNLILAGSLASYMDRPAPGYGLERGDLWKHSVAVAGGARLMAGRFGRQVAEEAYHAGLLCDIGKLAFEVLLRDVDPQSPEWCDRPFPDLEAAHFGIDHASLGAEIGRRWNLPTPLLEAISYHHRPALAGEGAILAAAVHVADYAATMLGIGLGREGLRYTLDPAAMERLALQESNFNQILERIGPMVEEAESFLLVSA
jgi:HD-like signal output (HDOD) protein